MFGAVLMRIKNRVNAENTYSIFCRMRVMRKEIMFFSLAFFLHFSGLRSRFVIMYLEV